MARIRTIKPELPQSETLGKVSRDARLLFVLLWTIADDDGRTRAAPRLLAGILFPYDADAAGLIEQWLSELEQVGCVRRYAFDGSNYLDIPGWFTHQKIDKPTASRLPTFEEAPPIEADKSPLPVENSSKPREPSANFREPSPSPREGSSLDLGREGIGREGKGTSPRCSDVGASAGNAPEPAGPPEAPEGPKAADRPTPRSELTAAIGSELAAEVVDHRSRMKRPLTVAAAGRLAKKFVDSGSPQDAARMMIDHAWQGFEVSWFANATAPKSRAGPNNAHNTQRGGSTTEAAEKLAERIKKGEIRLRINTFVRRS